jgi:hypothetical protein
MLSTIAKIARRDDWSCTMFRRRFDYSDGERAPMWTRRPKQRDSYGSHGEMTIAETASLNFMPPLRRDRSPDNTAGNV